MLPDLDGIQRKGENRRHSLRHFRSAQVAERVGFRHFRADALPGTNPGFSGASRHESRGLRARLSGRVLVAGGLGQPRQLRLPGRQILHQRWLGVCALAYAVRLCRGQGRGAPRPGHSPDPSGDHRGFCSSARRSVTRSVAPWPLPSLKGRMLPPDPMTKFAAECRPSPVPSSLVV